MIIGLTGKSCSGKNVAADYMKTLGWKVLDLDEIGHDLLKTKEKEIEKEFGTANRRELAKIVFQNPDKLKLLESILHPQIIEAVLEAEKTNPIVVANGALIHRSGLDRICRYVVYIDASFTVRMMRALSRDSISAHDFLLRDEAQKDVDFRDVEYQSKLIVVDNETDCSDKLAEVCKSIIQDQGIL